MQDMNLDNNELKKKNVKVRRYPKEKCNKHIGSHLVPCLLNVRASSTLSVLLLSEHVFKALKCKGTHSLNTMEGVHHVGLNMGVLIGPTKEIQW
jgi:hypothetical protein